MINLQDHCTSLELSKKLKDAGFKQDSLFYWEVERNNPCNFSLMHAVFGEGSKFDSFDYYSAFTASELMEFLPAFINEGFNDDWPGLKYLRVHKCATASNIMPDTYSMAYLPLDYPNYEMLGEESNLSEAIAKRIITLFEIGFLKLSHLMELPK